MRRAVIVGACLVGCGPVIGVAADGTTGAGGAEGPMSGAPTVGSVPTPPPSTTMPATTAGTTAQPTTAGGSTTGGTDTDGGSTDSCDFICPGDAGDPSECDVFLQDCPAGFKCMPWANDGGTSWNATKCSPIAVDPEPAGAACVVEGSPVSGVDNCDATSMCFWVDTDTLEGVCANFCTGSPNDPACPDACEECTINGEGVLAICLPECDPIAQDCPEGNACYAAPDGFYCAPDVSGAGGLVGDDCAFINECAEGNVCAPGDRMPDCEASGCCSPVCTVGDDAPCSTLPGTQCVPFFEDALPEGCVSADAGLCVFPEK